jgi:hypothetical protein
MARAPAGEPLFKVTRARPDKAAPAGSRTERVSSKVVRHVTTSGLAATAASTVPAWTAPSATSGAALPGVRFHTVVGCPASMNAPASAWPIDPSPMTVTGVRSSPAMLLPAPSQLSSIHGNPGRTPNALTRILRSRRGARSMLGRN